ncbi:T-cell-specific guanine nucleotide triphosphate-binding protein 2-like [Mytilus trossulus]|uniref:T-cell-specific guanine nucleotide triphosphate-binding protein 2-like n=1 Tax=Mytilus trossulus TaxID=6551 RepID=UPI0030064A4A
MNNPICDLYKHITAQSIIPNNDHDTERGLVSDSSDDEDQTDTWNVEEKLDSISVSNGEQVRESDEELVNEKHSGEKESSSGEQVKEPDEVLINEKHSTEIGLSSDAETLEDEILKDIGLGSIKQEVLHIFKADGPKSAVSYLNENVSMWKNATVRIAVAGKSSVGKSTFINAIRDVNSTDEGSANEGDGETTLVVQEYRHPKNKEIIYCDLPGYGTVTMTRKMFLEKVKLLDYDLFFIFINPVPTEDDQWLTEQLRKVEKKFCFVRAKLDLDIKNHKKMGIAAENVPAEIRRTIFDAVNDMSPVKEDVDIFLISNKNFKIGDMKKLISFIEAKLSSLKFDAFAFCLSSIGKEMIEVTYQRLQNRISSLALMLAWCDYGVLNYCAGEIDLYYHSFGLDSLVDDYRLLNLRHPFSADYIGTLIDRLCEDFPGILKQVVPIYNTVVLYRTYKRFFEQLLDELKDDCCTMIAYTIKKKLLSEETENLQ